MSDISDVIGDVDLSTIEPMQGFDVLPAGWYSVEIENAEVVNTKAGNGKMLKIEMVVLDEAHAGRKLFVRLNLANPNPKAVEIGMREMSAIGSAVGLLKISDTTELFGKRMSVRVTIKQEDGREPFNEVRGYKAIEGATAPVAKPVSTPAAKPAVAATAAKPATAKRPWEK